MAKNWKSLLCLLLALVMVFSVSACSKGGDSKANNSASGSDAEGGEGEEGEEGDAEYSDLISTVKLSDEVNQYGWTVPEETVTIQYYYAAYEMNQEDEAERLANAGVDQVMKDEFNLVFEEITFEEDDEERLNIMRTSDTYPAVIVGTSNTQAAAFVEQGRTIKLNGYLDLYGQNIIEGLGDYIGMLTEEDGSIYQMPWDWGHNTDYMGQSFSVRNDMLNEQNLPLPDSFQSYYETIKALVEAYPTNAGGETTYGLTTAGSNGREFYNAPLAYLGYFSTPTGYYWIDPETHEMTYWVDTDGGRFVANYINQFYRDGLIDPDFQTKDYDGGLAFMSNERVVGNIGTWWHPLYAGVENWAYAEDDWTIEKRFDEVNWIEEGYGTPNLVSDSFIRSYRNFITDVCENPDAVVMYWNWECSGPLAQQFLAMGPAGEDRAWQIDENGDVKVDERYWYGQNEDGTTFDWATFEDENGAFNYWMMCPGYVQENYMDDRSEGYAEPTIAANMWDLLPDYDQLDKDRLGPTMLSNMYNLDTYTTYMFDYTQFLTTWSSDSKTNDIYLSINEKLLQDWCLCITAETPEDCDAMYDQMVEDLHALDLDELVAAQQEAYDHNRELLGVE